ncbi:MAG: transglycosylase SLT domain-containing protein, partial [Pseudonocardia sp.]|nr:transglycosylase SLT domain-containing protein [Pseudonocardia sp.]
MGKDRHRLQAADAIRLLWTAPVVGAIITSVAANLLSMGIASAQLGVSGPAEHVVIPPTSGSVVLVAVPGHRSLDLILGQPDEDEHVSWRRVTGLWTAGLEADQWTGYACLTGSGRYAVATYAPTWFANKSFLRDRGAFAAVVDLQDGSVRTLIDRVSLKYHTPGCGLTDDVVLTRNQGENQESTDVLVIDAARAAVRDRISVDAQLTSVVPLPHGIVASVGRQVVGIGANGKLRPLTRAGGQTFDLRPAADGGVDFLAAEGDRAVATHAVNGKVAVIGDGPLDRVALLEGKSGQNLLVGPVEHVSPAPGGPKVLWRDRPPRAISPDGGVLVIEARAASASRGEAGSYHIETADPKSGQPVVQQITPSVLRSATGTASSGRSLDAASTSDGSPCAVPRNDYHYQVLQPLPEQVEWAVDQAVKGQLYITRPPNWDNNGSSTTYTPQSLFPPPVGVPQVPAQVLLGILAQESNFKQASYHAAPGDGGNPLVADYYGSGGGVVTMNPTLADCGYGIAQVTDHMRTDDTTWTAQQKVAVALDYAANIAAGLQILQRKWDDLSHMGILANGGDPHYVENWYMAVWAYNSGIFPDNKDGQPWGLGWTNNPANADYPPNRQGFLRATYADAEHPGDWPYQERVMGWAETAQLNLHGNPSYTPTSGRLSVPSPYQFCSASNECDSQYTNKSDPSLSYCKRADRHCWWHEATTWLGCPSSACHGEVISYPGSASEPLMTPDHPPRCSGGLPSGAIIVDDVPDTAWNVVGCGERPSGGSFEISYGRNVNGALTSQIDFHQIGAGYGGHFWFAHTIPGGSNYEGLHVTVSWQPPALTGWYRAYVHIPDHGADTGQAHYTVDLGAGRASTRVVPQRWNQNTWFNLGVVNMAAGGGRITSSNITDSDWGVGTPVDIGWDAVAYVPSTRPTDSYVALGDSYSAGEGVEPYDANSDVGGATPGFRDACHRSTSAYPRQIAPSGDTTDFHFIACSGSVINDISGTGTNWNESPQLKQGYLDDNVTRVTLSVGGNDAR